MITVACLLNGSRYGPEWVYKLQAGVDRWMSVPHRFVCFTNEPLQDVETIALERNWPTWWARLEMFERLQEPTVSLDLDLLLMGNINWLALGRPPLTMLKEPNLGIPNGSVMYWDGDLSHLAREFAVDPEHWQHVHRATWPDFRRFADQAFIAERITPHHWSPEHFHVFSQAGQLVNEPANGAEISVCLGEPKFDRCADLDIVRQHWTR